MNANRRLADCWKSGSNGNDATDRTCSRVSDSSWLPRRRQRRERPRADRYRCTGQHDPPPSIPAAAPPSHGRQPPARSRDRRQAAPARPSRARCRSPFAPHTETPTAACAAVGVSSQSPIGFRRINPSDPGDQSGAPIARPLSDRALDRRNLRAGCRSLGPRHCCHRPLTVTKVRCYHRQRDRSRESSVSRFQRVRLLPSFRIAPAACPLARSPVLQYVHSIRLCLDVNRLERAIFNTVLTPPTNTGVGSPGAGSAPK
jgi:hypothetical protein